MIRKILTIAVILMPSVQSRFDWSSDACWLEDLAESLPNECLLRMSEDNFFKAYSVLKKFMTDENDEVREIEKLLLESASKHDAHLIEYYHGQLKTLKEYLQQQQKALNLLDSRNDRKKFVMDLLALKKAIKSFIEARTEVGKIQSQNRPVPNKMWDGLNGKEWAIANKKTFIYRAYLRNVI